MGENHLYITAAIVVVVAAIWIWFAWYLHHRDDFPSKSLTLQKPKGLFSNFYQLLSKSEQNWQETLRQLEEKLLEADVGVTATQDLLSDLEKGDTALTQIKSKIRGWLSFSDWHLPNHQPAVLYFVGINGVGKTTTLGKIANFFKLQGKKTMLVAADTFRAAASEQLKTWAERAGADFVGSVFNADPASVIFDGIQSAKAKGHDVVLVDTAGRLHTKTPLMDQLSKMARVPEKELGRKPDEVWLVLDAQTGQNGLNQARVFLEAAKVTGIVLTKYDGSARGGFVIQIARELKLPIRFLGIGEKMEDLIPFDSNQFVEGLFE